MLLENYTVSIFAIIPLALCILSAATVFILNGKANKLKSDFNSLRDSTFKVIPIEFCDCNRSTPNCNCADNYISFMNKYYHTNFY